MAAYLAQLAGGSPVIEQLLVAEFPRVRAGFEDLLRRLRAHYELKQPGAALSTEEGALLLAALQRHEKAYLARSLARMLDAINAVFPSGAPRPLVPEDTCALALRLCRR